MAYNTILDRSMFTIFFFSTMLLLLTLVFKIVIDCLHNEYCLCNVLSQSAAVTSQQGRQSEDDVRLCLLPIYSNRYVMHIIVVCGKITVALSRRNAAGATYCTKNLCHKFAIVTVAVVSILRSSSNIALKSNILAYVEMFPGDAGSACIVRSVP